MNHLKKKNKLKLYLVSQTENSDYDTYDSFVIACEHEDVARNTNPQDGCVMTKKDWSYLYSTWCPSPDHVIVTYLGIADASVKHGIVCSSFNAG
jgi:hypothetical protein